MNRVVGIVVLFIVIGFTWWFFKTDYEFHHYKFKGCENSSFTVINYSKIGARGLIFTGGFHEKIPNSNYIINSEISGFDSYFDCIVTCGDEKLIVNYYEGYFDPHFESSDILVNRVQSDEFMDLIKTEEGIRIKIY